MSVLQEPSPARQLLRRLQSVPFVPEARRGAGAPQADAHTMERCAWTLVWLGVLTGGVNLWGFWWSSAAVVVLAALMVLGGVAGMVACWVAEGPRSPWLQRLAMGAVLVATAVPQLIVIHTRNYYTTDAAAFDDVSARALVHGRDPYTASMAPAARLLQDPAHYWTYTATGGHVAHASYPAGSFLVDVPALVLGLHRHIVDWTDLAAWLLTAVLLFVLLPRSLRWLGALVTLTPIYVGMFANSGTDAAFLPFMVLAVWRWDRFAAGPAAGRARWIGPVALGLACAIKQLPWFCVPILAAGVGIEAYRAQRAVRRTVGAYLAVVGGVFAAVNLPFVVWQPDAWLHGTLTPFIDPLVADGQGLVTLATHGVTGGVDLGLLTVAGGLAFVAVMAAFFVWYGTCKRVWPLLLPVVFFFSARSLSSYLVDLFPVAVVAVLTVAAPAPGRIPPAGRPPARWRRLLARPAVAVGVPVLGVVLASTLALSGGPLQLAVRSVRTSQAGRSVDALTVNVRNGTGTELTAHFLVNTGDNPDGFWHRAGGGPVVLAPHASATLTLYPPVPTTAPQHGAHWLVEAYTADPRSLSTSPLVLWRGRG